VFSNFSSVQSVKVLKLVRIEGFKLKVGSINSNFSTFVARDFNLNNNASTGV
jgi:hypothetical protein